MSQRNSFLNDTKRSDVLNNQPNSDLSLRISRLEQFLHQSLAELKKETGLSEDPLEQSFNDMKENIFSLSNQKKLELSEQSFIDMHENSFPLRSYQRKLETQLFHLIVAAITLSTNQIKPLPSKSQNGVDLANSAIGAFPIIGSTVRGVSETVSSHTKIALDNITIRNSTFIARIFGTPDHMSWIIKQLARKLTLARLTGLTKNKNLSQPVLKFHAFNAQLLGHGDMMDEEVAAYQDAKMILDIAIEISAEIFEKMYEKDNHIIILEMILRKILGDDYQVELNKLLLLEPLETTEIKNVESINTNELKLIDFYIPEPINLDNKRFAQQYISISKGCPSDFKNIDAIHPKKSGANAGSNISVFDRRDVKITFTIKQGRNIGHTLADILGYEVMRRILDEKDYLEQKNKNRHLKEEKYSHEPIKGIVKNIIAPSYMVLKVEENKTMSTEEIINQIWTVSEWSQDQLSFEACKLFGLEKRPLMAGTFKKYLFTYLREINEKCQLGLEFVVIPSIYTADKDLHLENILLKMNTINVKSSDKIRVNELLEEFQNTIKMQSKNTVGEYVARLIDLIRNLQSLGVYVYFQKIDHDNAFRHFSKPEEKVTLNNHRTSPLYVSKSGIETQATLHIAELTGTDEKGVDQLLFSPGAMKLIQKNTLSRYSNILRLSADILFQDIQNAISFINMSNEDKKMVEYKILNTFYYYISELTIELNKDKQIDFQIQSLKNQIVEKLLMGSIYKMNNLHLQLYERALVRRPKGDMTLSHICFGDFCLDQLKICQTQFIYCQWEKVKSQYMDNQKKLGGFFTSKSSDESYTLINDLESIFSYLNEKSAKLAFDKISDYLRNNSHRALGKILIQELNMIGFDKLDTILKAEQDKFKKEIEEAEKFNEEQQVRQAELEKTKLEIADNDSTEYYNPSM